jgi:hypothetical protein
MQGIEEAFFTIFAVTYPSKIECCQQGRRQRQNQDAGVERGEAHLADAEGKTNLADINWRFEVRCSEHANAGCF